jgi:peptidyl-tRNA hydrolase
MNNKEYIVVREDVPDYFVPVICAHASLIGHLAWHALPCYQNWLANSFRKVVVQVPSWDFLELKEMSISKRVVTESGLGGKEVAIVVCPGIVLPDKFKQYKLWKPGVDIRS